jgi:tRNA uridine 5-carboxymethylaminomethyl modification enzyme
MFTSRAEYRLLLRADNTDRRLMRYGYENGLINENAFTRSENKAKAVAEVRKHLNNTFREGKSLGKFLRRRENTWRDLIASEPELAFRNLPDDFWEAIEIEEKYGGYIERQQAQVERFRKLEDRPIPRGFDYESIHGLRTESRKKLMEMKPISLGQASRIPGVNPADISILLVALHKRISE